MTRRGGSPSWIAVDMSPAGMQAWALDRNDAVMMKVRSAQGLAQVAADAFETVLFNLVRPWLVEERTPVMISGLSGLEAKGVSLSVASIPCRLADQAPQAIPTDGLRLDLHALPGLHQAGTEGHVFASESLIRGVVVSCPEFHGFVCIPGQQTVWAGVRAGEVFRLQDFMTAELAELLVPRTGDGMIAAEPGLNKDVFAEALAWSLTQPELLAQHLIAARSDPDPTKARLKGHLIGAELAGARDFWQGQRVLVVGPGPWSDLYSGALVDLGVSVQRCDRDDLTLSGLKHAYRSLSETFA